MPELWPVSRLLSASAGCYAAALLSLPVLTRMGRIPLSEYTLTVGIGGYRVRRHRMEQTYGSIVNRLRVQSASKPIIQPP
jgi:hypothetical protein